VCYSVLRNEADAQEVMQETLLKAFTHLEQIRMGAKFKAWLLQIAMNEARMRRRKDRRHLYESIEQYGLELEEGKLGLHEIVDWRELPSDTMERKEVQVAIMCALDTLPDSYREIFALRDMQQLSLSEAAQILGISESTATTRLHRARLQMRNKLTPLFARPAPKWIPLWMMMADMGKRLAKGKMVSCKRVIRELSNYIEGDLAPDLRSEIEGHLKLCHRCSLLLDSTKKLLYLVGDERVYVFPPGDCERLRGFLCQRLGITG